MLTFREKLFQYPQNLRKYFVAKVLYGILFFIIWVPHMRKDPLIHGRRLSGHFFCLGQPTQHMFSLSPTEWPVSSVGTALRPQNPNLQTSLHLYSMVRTVQTWLIPHYSLLESWEVLLQEGTLTLIVEWLSPALCTPVELIHRHTILHYIIATIVYVHRCTMGAIICMIDTLATFHPSCSKKVLRRDRVVVFPAHGPGVGLELEFTIEFYIWQCRSSSSDCTSSQYHLVHLSFSYRTVCCGHPSPSSSSGGPLLLYTQRVAS